jgi:hypothetical protein
VTWPLDPARCVDEAPWAPMMVAVRRPAATTAVVPITADFFQRDRCMTVLRSHSVK